MTLTPSSPVWLATLAGPAHRPDRAGRTACGEPATTSDRRTATGITTTWAAAAGTATPCPNCWPTTSEGAT